MLPIRHAGLDIAVGVRALTDYSVAVIDYRDIRQFLACAPHWAALVFDKRSGN
jgi:hypothetical protein